jgi:hypothetical protein
MGASLIPSTEQLRGLAKSTATQSADNAEKCTWNRRSNIKIELRQIVTKTKHLQIIRVEHGLVK